MQPSHEPPDASPLARAIQRFPVKRLKRHAAYTRLFGAPPRHVVDALVASLRHPPTLRTPVEVLPGGAVLFGPEYVLAAKAAGVTELEVVVLTNLAEAGEAAVEAYIIDAALRRGQHGRMAQLRCLQRALKISREVPPELRQGYHYGDLIAHAMRLSGKDRRTILHYTQVLEAPRTVQDALDAGAINLVRAKAVAKLPQDVQDTIARAIRDGDAPAEVVRRHVAPPPKRRKTLLKARDAAVKSLEAILGDIGDRVGDINSVTRGQHQTLVRMRSLLVQLLRGVRVADETQWAANRAALRQLLQGETSGRGVSRPEAEFGHDEHGSSDTARLPKGPSAG